MFSGIVLFSHTPFSFMSFPKRPTSFSVFLVVGVDSLSYSMIVVYRQLIITIFRMPIYPVLNKANDPEYWLLIGRESGQVSHEY